MNTPDNTEIYHKLSLLYRPGNNRLAELMGVFEGRLSELLDITIRDPKNPILRLNENERVHTALFSEEKYKKIRDDCEKKRISLITPESEFYPPLLREIYNPPVMLYAVGDKSALLSGLSLAVVGARDPSEYSSSVTVKLIRALQKSEVKWTIVSGFARGIDITAHISALRYGAKTVAVKGCGLLYSYPKQNENYIDIIKRNGVIISEYPPYEPAKAMYFPVRNRIIAGMSAGTLVIEASEKSGSLVTANLAADFGRDVFCIPPRDITMSRYFGNVALLRDGVTPLYGLRDLIFENVNTTLFIAEKFTEKDDDEQDAKPQNASDKKRKRPAAAKGLPRQPQSTSNNEADYLIDENDTPDAALLEGGAKIIAEKIFLAPDGMTAEDISLETDLDVLDIIDILTGLEIDGYIRKRQDSRFIRV